MSVEKEKKKKKKRKIKSYIEVTTKATTERLAHVNDPHMKGIKQRTIQGWDKNPNVKIIIFLAQTSTYFQVSKTYRKA